VTDTERLDTLPRLIADKQAQRATRLSDLDYPGEWTQRERTTYAEASDYLDQQIRSYTSDFTSYRDQLFTVRHLEDRLSDLDKWEAFVISARKTLCEELLSLPKYIRERSEREQQQNLELSIDTIDRGPHILPGSSVFSLRGLRLGDLMIEAGLLDPNLQQFSGLRWQGSTKDVQRERAALTKELATAQWGLDRARDHVDALIAVNVVETTT